MLSNLMKYEVQATRRIFLPLYGLIIVFACINKAFFVTNIDKIKGIGAIPFWISMTVYVLLIAALFVMTLVMLIQRFYKNLLSDEGYLSFTLPVKTHLHLDSKLLVTVLWIVLSFLVAILSIFLLVIDARTVQHFGEVWPHVVSFLGQFGSSVFGLMAEGIVLVLLSIAKEVLHIYLSIAVGNFSSKHKLLVGFGVFIGINVIEQIVASLLMTAGIQTGTFENFRTAMQGSSAVPTLAGFMGISIAYSAVFGGLFYFFTNWVLSRKLNLE